MSRSLNDLDSRFKLTVFEFLARLTEANIPVLIVDTLRTPAEHQANLAAGRSWIGRSLHLDGLAIDICPYTTFQDRGPDKLNWDANDPIWETIARIGEKLGMRAGYRWEKKDCGHFEYVDSERRVDT